MSFVRLISVGSCTKLSLFYVCLKPNYINLYFCSRLCFNNILAAVSLYFAMTASFVWWPISISCLRLYHRNGKTFFYCTQRNALCSEIISDIYTHNIITIFSTHSLETSRLSKFSFVAALVVKRQTFWVKRAMHRTMF